MIEKKQITEKNITGEKRSAGGRTGAAAIIKKTVGLIVFLAVLGFVFSRVTYLFRNTDQNRYRVAGIKSEPDNVDMVYIGGSVAFGYWQPLKAFKDCGFTSYNLATETISVESILPFIKYTEKYKDPELYVIDARPFQYHKKMPLEAGLRNASDSLDVTFLPRYEMINDYFMNRNVDESDDISAYYFDIAKYHTNYANLGSEDAWKLMNNTCESSRNFFKGYVFFEPWCYLKHPEDFKTDERKELLYSAEKDLEEILDYCKKKGLKVLLTVCPYSVTREEYSQYNTIEDIAGKYGAGFINTNDYYEEMGLDFSKDFSDFYHVNVFGAEKYTQFLENYIMENYSLALPDPDSLDASWTQAQESFAQYGDTVKENIEKLIEEARQGVEKGKLIRNTVSFSDWAGYVKDYRYSLLTAGDGTVLAQCSADDVFTLEYLGYDFAGISGNDRYVSIISDPVNENEIPQPKNGVLKAEVGQSRYKSDVLISDDEGQASIIIDDEECSCQDPEGVNVVVFDNYYRTLIDSVTLKTVNGNIIIQR